MHGGERQAHSGGVGRSSEVTGTFDGSQQQQNPATSDEVGGLRSFNLGTVPASITPPRTWKRAAWFSGLVAAGVLVVLMVIAGTLVGTTVQRDGLDALPGYPSELLLPSNSTTSSSQKNVSGGGKTSTARTGVTETRGATGTNGGNGSQVNRGTPSSSSPPAITTISHDRGLALVSVEKLADQTITFFNTVPADLQKAFDTLAGPALKGNGFTAFAERFSSLNTVDVKSIQVDPTRGVTTSVVQVRMADGTTSTQQRELLFTTSDIPLVNGERLVSLSNS